MNEPMEENNMLIQVGRQNVPGTEMRRDSVGGVTGMGFLNTVFFVSDGISLSVLTEASGVEGSTLNNWVKRGYIGVTVNKRYSRDQFARILIFNMLRETIMLERIDALLRYLNGCVNNHAETTVSESVLYDYICKILDKIDAKGGRREVDIPSCIEETISDYQEPVSGAGKRLVAALEIIVTAYSASLLRIKANDLFEGLDLRVSGEPIANKLPIIGKKK